MSVLSTLYPTLLDVAKVTGPDGKIAAIAELLNLQNAILDDMVWVEANGPTSHTFSMRTGLPTPTWKRFNYGIQPTKGTAAQATATMGHLSDLMEVDADIAELNGNSQPFMLSQMLSHLEGMNQEFAQTLFYGNEGTDPAEFTGLAPHYNSTSAASGDNVINSSTTSDLDNTSIWLIGWGPRSIYGIYPKGSSAGLQTTSFGKVMSENQGGTGLRGMVYRESLDWKCGLVVEDWRYAVRINYDLEDGISAASTGPKVFDLMVQAIHRLPSIGLVRPVFYMNRDSIALLDRQMMNRGTLGLNTVQDAEGKAITSFRGIPVKRCDSILSTESYVTT